jgi:uncharacterized protein YgiM (DUF1202 family)
MKTITLIIMLLTVGYNSNNIKTKISSHYNCPTLVDDGRCTGSASCSVCSNCSRCGHCSNGGSCGVCSSSSSNNFYTPRPKRKSRSTTSTYYYTAPKQSKIYYENETIIIYTKLINVREKPTTKSKVLEQLSYADEVLFIQKEGEWSKIQVKGTTTIGYVLTKLLN